MSGTIDGRSFPGKILLTLVGGSQGIFGRTVAGILLIVSYGATAIASSKIRDSLYYMIVALSCMGILFTVALMIVMNDTNTALLVARASEVLETVEAYVKAQNLFLGSVLVWLIGTLTTQLGIQASSTDGKDGAG